MYETLTGKRANIQQTKDISQLCNLQSKMVNSKPSLITQNKKMTISGLTKILQSRNKRYKNNDTFNYYNLPFRMSSIYKAQQASKSKEVSKEKKIRDLQTYRYQQLQECLLNICQQYCSFSLHSQIKIQSDNLQTKKNKNIPQIARGLRQLNIQQINKTNTQIGTSLRLIKYCGLATPYFQQLVRQIQLVKQHEDQDESILLRIFQSFGTCITDGILFKYLEELQGKNNKNNDEKWRYILLLFLLEAGQSRVRMKKFLYNQSQSQVFGLIQKYDNLFFQKKIEKYQLNQLIQYSNSLDRLSKKQKSIYCKKLTNIMNFQNVINLQTQFGQFNIQFENIVILAIINTLKWLQINFINSTDAIQFYRKIVNNFIIMKKQLSQIINFSLQPLQFQSLIHLKLMNYSQSFSLIQNYQQRLLLTLLICNQQKPMQKLFNISKNCNNSPQQQLVHKFQIQLWQQLKQNFMDHSFIDFIIDCTKFFKLQQNIDLLLCSKAMVESIDWQHLCALKQKQQMQLLMKSIIMGSIKIYHNTGAFLNTGIPIQKYLPYFQIQILIQGLIKVLMQDKSKFFGMISIFRGQNLPEKYQFLMTILQMLFQWYVLKESILQEDYKSLGLSLKSNLQENSEQIQMLSNSVSLTQSAKTNSILKIHNHEYIKKIGNPEFMEKINKFQQFQPLYINFLHTIIESICKAKNNRQKKFIRQKIYQWVQTYMRRLDDNMKRSKGQFYKKLSKLRQKSYSLTSLHQI